MHMNYQSLNGRQLMTGSTIRKYTFYIGYLGLSTSVFNRC